MQGLRVQDERIDDGLVRVRVYVGQHRAEATLTAHDTGRCTEGMSGGGEDDEDGDEWHYARLDRGKRATGYG